MRIDIYPNLVTPDECRQLADWANTAATNNWLDAGITSGSQKYSTKLRRTSRFYGDRFTHPPLALEIQERIRHALGIETNPYITGHGRDGIVINYTYANGSVYEHKDPRSVDGLATLRCNLLVQAPESGGGLYIEDKLYPITQGSVHCYLVSEHKHRVETVFGETPRILWMFGAHVQAEDWNNYKIRMKNVG